LKNNTLLQSSRVWLNVVPMPIINRWHEWLNRRYFVGYYLDKSVSFRCYFAKHELCLFMFQMIDFISRRCFVREISYVWLDHIHRNEVLSRVCKIWLIIDFHSKIYILGHLLCLVTFFTACTKLGKLHSHFRFQVKTFLIPHTTLALFIHENI
jgi:hypothetical protein